jgi:predicted nucleic acid-binding protein
MRPFLDANVVIYALADVDPRKQAIAQALLADRGASRPTLSTQVLAETLNVLTGKLQWKADDALAAVTLLQQRLRVVALTPETTIEALAHAVEHRLSGWDALILRAAQQADCDVLFSEDLQAGRRFGRIEVVNPLVLWAQEELAVTTASGRGAAGVVRRSHAL